MVKIALVVHQHKEELDFCVTAVLESGRNLSKAEQNYRKEQSPKTSIQSSSGWRYLMVLSRKRDVSRSYWVVQCFFIASFSRCF